MTKLHPSPDFRAGSGVATDKRPFGWPCLAETPISVHRVALQWPAAGPVALPRQSRLNGAGVALHRTGGQSDGLVAPSPGQRAGCCAATERRSVGRPRRAKPRINGWAVAGQPTSGHSGDHPAPLPGSAVPPLRCIRPAVSQMASSCQVPDQGWAVAMQPTNGHSGDHTAPLPGSPGAPLRCKTDRRPVRRPCRAKSRINGWAVAGQPTSCHSGNRPATRIGGPALALQPTDGQSDGLVAPSPGSAGGLSQCNRQAAIPVTTSPR